MTEPARRILVLGAGGHARVALDALEAAGTPADGVVTETGGTSSPLDVPVVASDADVLAMDPGSVVLVNGLGSTGSTSARRELFERFRAAGFHFATVRHPSAVVSPRVRLGEGAHVMAGAVLQPGTSIGTNSIVNTGASVDHDCIVGDHVHIAPGATLSGGIRVGDGAHIGTGATLLQGVVVGDDAVIAAGAVVVRDVGVATTVAGVPARPLGREG